MDVIRNIEAPHLRQDIPDFKVGDTVRLAVRVVEGDKVRQQPFQGVVMARERTGTRETFTVRKITDGVAIERIFPLHSPNLQSIEVVRRGRVRRAKLTYLRGRKGKSARIRESTRQKTAAAPEPPSEQDKGES
jgi:large subunit ribosomal protein L19